MKSFLSLIFKVKNIKILFVVFQIVFLGQMARSADFENNLFNFSQNIANNKPLFSSVSDSCYQPQTEISCDFYLNCLEKKQSCGNTGYAIGYGYKYCSRFLKYNQSPQEKQMTSRGLAWRDHTLICLQNALVGILKNWSAADWNDNKVCTNVKDFAFDSHPDCYVKSMPSFCELPLRDWRTLISDMDSKDLLGYRGSKQILKVAWMCKSYVVNKILFGRGFYSADLPEKDDFGNPIDYNNTDESLSELGNKLDFIETLDWVDKK